MKINEMNIVKRWSFMATKDLGIDRKIEAIQFAKLFKSLFEDELTQVDGKDFKYIKPIILGFSINNEGNFERCGVTECLDLDFITLDKEAAEELEWELMNKNGWFGIYQYAQSI